MAQSARRVWEVMKLGQIPRIGPKTARTRACSFILDSPSPISKFPQNNLNFDYNYRRFDFVSFFCSADDMPEEKERTCKLLLQVR
jgi:hypothetical protein